MPRELQSRLLRVLAEGEVLSIGASRPVSVDVRVISATHHPLDALVQERPLPRRPLLPAERRALCAAAAARTKRSRLADPEASEGLARAARSRCRPRRASGCIGMGGRGICASCAMCCVMRGRCARTGISKSTICPKNLSQASRRKRPSRALPAAAAPIEEFDSHLPAARRHAADAVSARGELEPERGRAADRREPDDAVSAHGALWHPFAQSARHRRCTERYACTPRDTPAAVTPVTAVVFLAADSLDSSPFLRVIPRLFASDVPSDWHSACLVLAAKQSQMETTHAQSRAVKAAARRHHRESDFRARHPPRDREREQPATRRSREHRAAAAVGAGVVRHRSRR